MLGPHSNSKQSKGGRFGQIPRSKGVKCLIHGSSTQALDLRVQSQIRRSSGEDLI